MTWCHDPDKAFDARCKNLGSEDWCKDNSQCPISGKDSKMFISVNDELTTGMLHENPVIVEISKDGKKFTVLKHDKFKAAEKQEYHISTLKHILTAGTE